MKASAAPLTGGSCTEAPSAPSSAPASRKWQCACTSMVLTFLPLTATGRVRDVPCACALSSRPQLQKTIPVAAAVPPLRKFRRVVIKRPSEDLSSSSPAKLGRCRRPKATEGSEASGAIHDPSVGVRRRHLPLLRKGRKRNSRSPVLSLERTERRSLRDMQFCQGAADRPGVTPP